MRDDDLAADFFERHAPARRERVLRRRQQDHVVAAKRERLDAAVGRLKREHAEVETAIEDRVGDLPRRHATDVHDHLREGDVVQAKVQAIKEDGKIDLSIKALQDPQPSVHRQRGADPEFEQKLKRFMRQSDERLVDYRRATEKKRK